MPSLKLTETRAKQLQNRQPQVDYWDTEIPGFVLKVGKRTKSFYVRYRIRGEPRRLTSFLGRYPEVSVDDARMEAVQILVHARRGRTPPQQPSAPNSTPEKTDSMGVLFGTLVEEFLAKHACHLNSAEVYRTVLGKLLTQRRPAWKHRPAAEIERKDLRDLLREVAAKHPSGARKLRTVLSSLFSWGAQEELVSHNPASRLARVSEQRVFGSDKTRDRVLSAEEIRELWRFLESQNKVTARLLQSLVLTGQRPGEIAQMRWSEIGSKWWTPPRELWKNKFPHRVFLADPIEQVLARVQPFSRNGLVFPTSNGSPCSTANLRAYLHTQCGPQLGFQFLPSDCRGTFITGLAQLGVREEIRMLCTNHKKRGIQAKNYDMYTYAREIEAAFRLWSDHVMNLVEGRSNVISFPDRA